MKKIEDLRTIGEIAVETSDDKRGNLTYIATVEGYKLGLLEITTPDIGLVTENGEVEPWLRFHTVQGFPAYAQQNARLRTTLQGYVDKGSSVKISVLLGNYDHQHMKFRSHLLTEDAPDMLIMAVGGYLRYRQEDDIIFQGFDGKTQIQFLITKPSGELTKLIVSEIKAYDAAQSERLGKLVKELRRNSKILKDAKEIAKEKAILERLAKYGESLEQIKPNYPFRVEVFPDSFAINGVRYFFSVSDMPYLRMIEQVFGENLPKLVPMALDQRYRQIKANVAYLKPFVGINTDFSQYRTRTKMINAALCGSVAE